MFLTNINSRLSFKKELINIIKAEKGIHLLYYPELKKIL